MAGRVYVVAGELSGDAHGAGLLRALHHLHPAVEVSGAGGPEMAAVGGEKVRDWVEDAAVVGVWEVLKHYSWFKARFDEMLAEAREFRPDVLLLIDYPGFNLRFAEAVKKELPETRIVYYISPQVWAWNKGRIPKMVRLIDEMLCLFPFEQPLFENAGLKTTFVGHPLVDELEERRIPGVTPDESLVGLFPGSRNREVSRLFPMMLETARSMHARRPGLRFEAPAASPKLAASMRALVESTGTGGYVTVTDGGSNELMQRAVCGVIASGTATLEAAYFGLPYCLVYKVAWPTYILGSLLVKLEFIGLVNILAGEEVVEELIQADAEPAAVERSLGRFLDDPVFRKHVQSGLAATAAKLGGPGAHERAAEAVDRWLRHA
ncbi:lipid-A-disaccharide synthase [Luteolibacter ambystomatis]|uniref:Lipid-A-disaccharide synthase n=1 Tax=Luteolibacter ambystomatis TaxID=2824561 RepID=A0A975J037_9BACT|nr:lipid-A-disaccharide synthase [Luteolibacter ambystomatis]QUE51553.1 lipid-A-disaccharide synthase [Luteolibacter ambystomatis]